MTVIDVATECGNILRNFDVFGSLWVKQWSLAVLHEQTGNAFA